MITAKSSRASRKRSSTSPSVSVSGKASSGLIGASAFIDSDWPASTRLSRSFAST
jgi:hypothetical protein